MEVKIEFEDGTTLDCIEVDWAKMNTEAKHPDKWAYYYGNAFGYDSTIVYAVFEITYIGFDTKKHFAVRI